MEKLNISNRAKSVIASPIRKFLPLMQEAESKGVKVFKINVGDPDLEPDRRFLSAIRDYNSQTIGYAPSPGMPEHMRAWQKYYEKFGVQLELKNMLPTVGCAEAIMLALQAVADVGEEVIVFEPLYTSYKSFAVMTGINLKPVTLRLEDNFALPEPAEIEKQITPKTRAIVIINPDNPTGKLWTEEELETILQLAEKHGLFVISDETYREIRFDGKSPVCLLSYPKAKERVILCDSVSKRFSMPGARIGCIASYNEEIMSGILKFAQARLSAGTLEQFGLVPLLKDSNAYVNGVVNEYQKRQQTVAEVLSTISGAVFRPSMGAFYQTVKLPVKDAEDFVKFMIGEFRYEGQTVMVTPMQDFYITPNMGKDEIRIAYVLKSEELKTALEILKRGLEEYLKK